MLLFLLLEAQPAVLRLAFVDAEGDGRVGPMFPPTLAPLPSVPEILHLDLDVVGDHLARRRQMILDHVLPELVQRIQRPGIINGRPRTGRRGQNRAMTTTDPNLSHDQPRPAPVVVAAPPTSFAL